VCRRDCRATPLNTTYFMHQLNSLKHATPPPVSTLVHAPHPPRLDRGSRPWYTTHQAEVHRSVRIVRTSPHIRHMVAPRAALRCGDTRPQHSRYTWPTAPLAADWRWRWRACRLEANAQRGRALIRTCLEPPGAATAPPPGRAAIASPPRQPRPRGLSPSLRQEWRSCASPGGGGPRGQLKGGA
jgi:hypothetical protein